MVKPATCKHGSILNCAVEPAPKWYERKQVDSVAFQGHVDRSIRSVIMERGSQDRR